MKSLINTKTKQRVSQIKAFIFTFKNKKKSDGTFLYPLFIQKSSPDDF